MQVGEVKQVSQIANADLRSRLQQPPNLKGGSDIVEKKNAAQSIGRNIIAILAAKSSERSQPPSSSNPTPAKGEKGRKKKDKKVVEKKGKANTFGEFYADMRGDSLIPNNK
ncbi:hypothetical protein Acr_00g0073920 [Actinidia rufa]|uniref:Uncharacterized protein n=1 Tax=Actinidia rufa TaxID=165716 RepID=A0A7J0DTK0_9ERIC|nr:hypothetical protein Acr_00g0073920 [Actinidia rufa]